MINLYSGVPSAGKSYHAIQLALRVLSWGRPVIANFPLKFSEKEIKKGYDKLFHFWTNENITIETLVKFALDHKFIENRKESQALVIIDEAGGRFNSREFKNSDRRSWIDFFSQHAKIGYDFLLVAQNDRMIDRQIRGYIENETQHRKVNNFGPFWILPFTVFVAIEYWYLARQRTGSSFIIFRKKIANKYDRFRMFDGFTFSPELVDRINAMKAGYNAVAEKPKKLADEDDIPPEFQATEMREAMDVPVDSIFVSPTEE